MKTKRNKTILNATRVVSKHNTVFMKSNTGTNTWKPINFQWIPVSEIKKPSNK